MWLCIVIHKTEVCANGASEQTHIEKKYLLTIAIPDYRPSVENVELSSPVQHNASPDKNSRTTVTVSFFDVTGIKPGPDLSPNQDVLRIASGTKPTHPALDWAGWYGKLASTLSLHLLPKLLPLEPFEETFLRKPRRLRRGPGCEDCRRRRRNPVDALGIY
ncbi:uncharacterized protein TNCV_2674711 [Trichonephila clavipes]|nr:uncharacterized protein TNCV_2674711 [Trichonephila clavipes]